jgi:hypothetical protein
LSFLPLLLGSSAGLLASLLLTADLNPEPGCFRAALAAAEVEEEDATRDTETSPGELSLKPLEALLDDSSLAMISDFRPVFVGTPAFSRASREEAAARRGSGVSRPPDSTLLWDGSDDEEEDGPLLCEVK